MRIRSLFFTAVRETHTRSEEAVVFDDFSVFKLKTIAVPKKFTVRRPIIGDHKGIISANNNIGNVVFFHLIAVWPAPFLEGA